MKRKTLISIGSWLLASAILAILITLLDPAKVWTALASTNLALMTASFLAVGVALLLKGLRWWLIARPLGHVSLVSCIRLTVAGLFLNALVPLIRGGDIARALVLAKESGLRRGEGLGTMALDKLMDMIGVAFLVIPLPFLGGIPDWIRWPPVVTVSIAIVLLAAGIVLRSRLRRGSIDEQALAKPLRWLASFAAGFDTTTSISKVALLLGLSAAIYAAFLGAVMLALASAGIQVDLATGLIVLLAIQFSAGIPLTPTSAGTMHGAIVGVLVATGTEPDVALGAAIVVHAAQLLPIIVPGALLSRSTAMGQVSDS